MACASALRRPLRFPRISNCLSFPAVKLTRLSLRRSFSASKKSNRRKDRSLPSVKMVFPSSFLRRQFCSAWLQFRAQHYVATVAEHFVFVHAGVVAWQGKAILLPGKSFSGKSTLTMALVDAGATYYSDEYAVLNAQGLVHPFSRMPRLRPDVQPPRMNSVPVASALPPLAVGLVLSAHYNRTHCGNRDN